MDLFTNISQRNGTKRLKEKQLQLCIFRSLLHDMEKKQIAKEQCVLADRDGTICRITLEERSIADLTIFPPEVSCRDCMYNYVNPG